jgi:RNA polymerase sigma factor (sigma-70 family)
MQAPAGGRTAVEIAIACQMHARAGSNGAMLEILAAWTSDHDGVPGAAGERAADAPRARDDALCAEAPRLRRLVHRLLGWRASAADLDDVVQDVLLAAFRHRERFRGDSSLRTWLTTIALRKAQRHANADRRRRRLRSLFGIAEPAVPDRQTDDERLDRTRAAMQQLRTAIARCWCCATSNSVTSKRSPRCAAAAAPPSTRACRAPASACATG